MSFVKRPLRPAGDRVVADSYTGSARTLLRVHTYTRLLLQSASPTVKLLRAASKTVSRSPASPKNARTPALFLPHIMLSPKARLSHRRQTGLWLLLRLVVCLPSHRLDVPSYLLSEGPSAEGCPKLWLCDGRVRGSCTSVVDDEWSRPVGYIHTSLVLPRDCPGKVRSASPPKHSCLLP
ncbi:hypothetical protein SAICODRAFT_30113 [Saitoella complicata NRRL Y-17804]|uniref:uncharacterized protein n=1 Tax=Saitoella complicata (strain BCRC 22490 / CBS 7301 / JCM 7358 / NBRC 10748 / NRRL Y-17804) TaxID=698492 RepID=UPI00086759C1|nr:uncharacterized protein SAICODRAFT_30113 [Saitoella complicata NRRL Y-17804]ODQ53387.1 hypothetical protein SAICODRAFT_30113 [Saitoella complicata NRRL Y-17804]